MDMNDRSWRKIEIGLGGKANGTPRMDGFQILSLIHISFNVVTGVYSPTNGCLYLDGKPYLCEHPAGKAKRPISAAMRINSPGTPPCGKPPIRSPKWGWPVPSRISGLSLIHL